MRFPENEGILDGHGNCLMPATPIFQKHCFFKKCPKNLTNFGKFQIFFLHFLLQFYRAFQWYIICFHTFSTLGCTDQNVNQEIGGYASFFQRLYDTFIWLPSFMNRCNMAVQPLFFSKLGPTYTAFKGLLTIMDRCNMAIQMCFFSKLSIT